MIDEGYVKFACDWTKAAAVPTDAIAELIEWRNRLHAAGLIGHDAINDVGFGNISCREPGIREFVVSATQTGHVPVATRHEFTRVVDYDIAANRVVCRGPLRASSESLTHAAIYELDPDYLAVVHVHSRKMWEALAGRIPTTGAGIAYGTPAMARELRRLYRDTDLAGVRMAVMAGHEGGLVSTGGSLREAAGRVLQVSADLPSLR
ncbi:MAG: class II aldolase/adducin family protein [Gammaproteobacteria bacterium]